ncbi:hypothetical protein PQX77_001262 [Marasmius sp. AFHP31]|nr:hypothetical protein PQX77_001262 [Marasmius sp. AFHP31]
MQSTFFPDAHGFSVFDSSFNHIQGNQYNYTNPQIPSSSTSLHGTSIAEQTTLTTTMVNNFNGNQINKIVKRRKKKPTEFDDFRILKRGDICRYQDVVQFSCNQGWLWCDPDCQCEFCKREKVIKTVCIGKVEGTRGTFTVMSYSGPGGRKTFERDFRQCLSVMTSRVPQMYAVDIGSVPSILYWNELVPAVVLKRNLGWMGQMYLRSLHRIWKCEEGELWMDSARGVICCGPEGPYPNLPYSCLEIEDMPSTVDLLQEDVCLRFMASCKSKQVDHVFVRGIRSAGSDVAVPESFDQPTVISALTQTPIAVGNNVWESIGCLVERKVLESGLTRFRVVGDGLFRLWNWHVHEPWLCQALGVFHARGIGLDDDLSVYGLVRHKGCLNGYLSCNQIRLQRQSQQPIYLFLHPPPSNQPDGKTSSLHFWSSHEDGQKPFPPDICNNLGLPTTLEYMDLGYRSSSWPTKSYKQLDEYQRLRGFDPTTTEFAQHLGDDRNIFHPVNDTDRFDEDYEERSLESLEPHSNMDHLDLSTTEYPAIQQGNISKKLDTVLLDSKDEPPSPDLATKRRRMGGGEGKIERRVHAEQNLHHKSLGACNEPSVPDLSLRTIRPLPRRSLPSEELYSLKSDTARPADCAAGFDSLSLQHYAYASPPQNCPLPGHPAGLPPTSTSFSPLHANTITTSSAALRTGISPRAYPEILQYGMATLSSRDESSQPVPEWSTYGASAEATDNVFPGFASTIPSSVFAQPGNDSTHASQTTRWPGVPPLGTSMNDYHRAPPPVLPNDLSIPPHTPPVGYLTDPGVHVHGPYPAILQGHHSFTPYQGVRTSLPDEHWNAPATQLEPQPVSSGPYSDPSVYEQPTSSNESHSLSPPTAPNDISISPYPSAIGHPINHSEILQTVDQPSHPMSFNIINNAPIHNMVPSAGFTETNSSVDGHGAPHPSEEPKYPPSEGCTSPPAAQHQQQSTVLSHPHPHPMRDTASYELVDLEVGASRGGPETRLSRWRSRMATMVRFLHRSSYFRFMLIWVFLALLLIEYGTSRGN